MTEYVRFRDQRPRYWSADGKGVFAYHVADYRGRACCGERGAVARSVRQSPVHVCIACLTGKTWSEKTCTRALRVLRKKTGPLYSSAIARAIGISRIEAQWIMRELEADGSVRRAGIRRDKILWVLV